MNNKSKYVFGGSLFFCLIIVIITVFNKFDALKMMPLIAPEEFLAGLPYITIGNIVLTQPSSFIIIMILGVFIVLFGIKFLQHHENFASRKYWGVSMVFWGIASLLAGISYQGFGYQLKAVGNTYCNFTDWFEVIYLLLMAISIGFLVIGMSYCVATGKRRKIMQVIAYISMPVYAILLTIGSLVPLQFLVSYELLCICFMPHFIWFFVINVKNYKKNGDILNKRFIISWLIFAVSNIVYFLYFWFGISEVLLNATGLWFNQNDVLHTIMLIWMIYNWFALPSVIVDVEEV